MTGESVFADTYALVEISEGNAAFDTFTDVPLVTSVFNLTELYFIVARAKGHDVAQQHIEDHEHCLAEVHLSTIADAMRLRLANKKERLSYADCIGYALAMQLNIPFLTGDKQFEGKPNVLFVR